MLFPKLSGREGDTRAHDQGPLDPARLPKEQQSCNRQFDSHHLYKQTCIIPTPWLLSRIRIGEGAYYPCSRVKHKILQIEHFPASAVQSPHWDPFI